MYEQGKCQQRRHVGLTNRVGDMEFQMANWLVYDTVIA
jgi:hypothetical protein